LKLITRDTDYAVSAICFIAGKEADVVSVDEMVKGLKMPRPFLRKILQTLNKQGMLRSYKGKGGGFALAYPPNKILLLDLMRSFQGPLSLNKCMFKKATCNNLRICPLRKKIKSIERHVVSELETVTIASLLK